MYQLQGGFRVMHWHGGDTWVPMSEGSEHNVVSHDPERAWMKGARIFRCTACEEEIAIAPTDPADIADAEHPHPAM